MTLVVVSHDLASLKCIADNVLVLHEGQALFHGTLEQLQAQDNAYLQRFLRRESGPASETPVEPLAPEVRAALDKWLGA